MKKIGGKLFLSFLGMTVLTIALLWLVQAVIMKDTYLNSRVAAVNKAVQAAALSGNINFDALKEELNINLVQLNQDGTVRSVTQGMPMMGMIVKSVQVMFPDQMNGKVTLIESGAGAGRFAMLGYAVKGGGYVIAVFSLADVDAAARILREQLWLITVLLLLSSVFLAIVLTRMFARPIRAVTGAARELASGKLDVKLPVPSKDEIGELTVALNDLSVQLHQTDMLRKELIANVSHELRAPLTVIQGYAETVRDVTWPIEEKRTLQLNMISREAARLSRVVTDILDYSKLQAGVEKLAISHFAICPVLVQAQKRYEQIASRRQVSIELQCSEQDVRFDRDKLDQILDNLLNNAIGYAEPESTVLISVVDNHGISRISVRNNGLTIPPEARSLIWDRFYRADGEEVTRRLGTGLGLSIVKSILQKHQVAFGVDSENGVTTFWFDTCPIS